MIRTLVLLLALTSSAFAADAPSKKPKKKLDFAIDAGAYLRTNLARRGATLYNSWQASPFLYFAFFQRRLEFLVTSLEYNDFISEDVMRGRTKISTVTDRPFFKTGEPTGPSNQRRTSWEWTNTLELFLPDREHELAELDLVWAKDLQAHSGNYLELTPRITLAKLWENEEGKARVVPQLFASVGWGDARHNSYQYGSEASLAGFNHLTYGLMIVSPVRIDSHYPVFTFSHYQVLGNSKQGGLVRDKTSGFNATALVAFSITK